jgi:hypothetical protein
MTLYVLRQTSNGKHIDIVPVGATKGTPAVLRVPVRSGLENIAGQFAWKVKELLNEHMNEDE